MSISFLSVLALGLVLGLRHALDADHLAAVSTMATERHGMFASSLVGALWGLGHTLSLMAAGVVVIVFHIEIGERVGKALELCVGIMLIALGADSLRRLARGGEGHPHAHEHGPRLRARPLLVGMVHGLAGSAALTMLVIAAVPSPALGLLYLGVFGIGSIGGMVIMSAVFSLPAKLTAIPIERTSVVIRGLAGGFSLCLGVFMVCAGALEFMWQTNNS
jgi:hypothetical protein